MLKSSAPMFGKRDANTPPTVLMTPAVTTAGPAAAQRPAPVHAGNAASGGHGHSHGGAHQAHQEKQPPAEPGAGNRMVVGPDVRLKGAEILDCDTLVVEGHVEATIDSRILRIAENGEFIGKVGIDVAEIRGNFNGDLQVREQLIIHSTGKVSGTIRYGKLLIEEGGELSGDIQTMRAEAKKAVVPAASAAPQRSLAPVAEAQRHGAAGTAG